MLRRRTRRERMQGASGARVVNGDAPVDAGGDPHGGPVVREPDVVREVDGRDAAAQARTPWVREIEHRDRGRLRPERDPQARAGRIDGEVTGSRTDLDAARRSGPAARR